MQQSNYLQIVRFQDRQEILAYHSLYGAGNLQFLFDPCYVNALESFIAPRPIGLEDDVEIIENLASVGFLVDDSITPFEERRHYDSQLEQWANDIVGGEKIAYLNLSVSEVCNFSCPHCSRGCGANAGKPDDGHEKIMSWGVAKSAIDFFWHSCCAPRGIDADIHFGSDEPLLNWDVVKKSILYTRELNSSAILSINTNLSLLTSAMASFLKENNVDIISSLDGSREGNDRVRMSQKGGGTFDTIVKKSGLLRDIDYPVSGFITTILDANWDNVDSEFIDWAAQENLRSVAIDVDLVTSMSHSPQECAIKLISLYDYINSKGLICGGSWINPFKTLLNGSSDGMPAYCKCTKGCGISVSPGGLITTCSGSSMKLGSLSSTDQVFAKGNAYHSLIQKNMQTAGTECDGCPVEAVCKNQCFMTSESSIGSSASNRKKEMCEIYRATTYMLLQRELLKEISA